QGERGRDTVKALVEQAATLGIERQKEAAAAMAPHVAAAEARPEFAIGPDVSRAFADFLDFMRNRDTGKKWGTVEEYLKQGDMLDPRSEIAGSILRMLGERKSPGYVAEVARVYAEAAKGEQDGLFGEARKPAEIWREAEKAVAEDGGKRWSIKKLEDGEECVVIDRDDEIAKIDLRNKKSIYSYLMQHVGDELGKGLVIGKSLPGEYVYGASARGDSPRIAKAKAKLATSLDEAVRASGKVTAEPAKHKKREGGVYYKAPFAFAIPRPDGTHRGYRADILFYTANDNKLLYDVVDINDAPEVGSDTALKATARTTIPGATRNEPTTSGADARSIAQSGVGGNGPTELADKVRRIDPEAKRWAIAKAAEVKPATDEEYADVIARFGETKDYGEAAWLFPDGRMPKPQMKRTAWGTVRNHDSIFYILNRGKLELGDMSGYIDTFAGGAMRLDLDNGGIEMTRKPSDVQMDAIYDICEAAYQKMEADDLDTFRVDISDDNGSTLFTLQYPRKTSARRIIDDIKNYYDSGWIPDNATGPEVERRGGTGAERRWSIATRLDEERQLIEERGGQLLLAHHGTD
ncbi:MAG: hypothetical protein KBT68_07445, partial [bacterium]|nr:hypothetical protein [Candidatus Colisoma equi]